MRIVVILMNYMIKSGVWVVSRYRVFELFFFFFFQAEDGIRDWSVTGVQTCALPILPGSFNADISAGMNRVSQKIHASLTAHNF